jgi:hypothetical protein
VDQQKSHWGREDFQLAQIFVRLFACAGIFCRHLKVFVFADFIEDCNKII